MGEEDKGAKPEQEEKEQVPNQEALTVDVSREIDITAAVPISSMLSSEPSWFTPKRYAFVYSFRMCTELVIWVSWKFRDLKFGSGSREEINVKDLKSKILPKLKIYKLYLSFICGKEICLWKQKL